jgi:hypothetical protein
MSPSSTPAKKAKPRQSLTGRKRRSSAAIWTWASVGLVIVVVLAIVLVDNVGNTTPKPKKSTLTFGTMPLAIVNEVTTIPSTVFNDVGINSPAISVGGFQRIVKQKSLTFVSGTKTLPGFIYWGAEYCPYCAATRWAIVAALGRFGTFKNLQEMISSSTDVDPNTHTFSFRGSSYTSQYLVFKPYEVEDRAQNLITSQQPSAAITKVINKYNPPPGSFPFLDIGNNVFLVGAPYDPSVLAGESWSQIAAGLNDPSNYATEAIVTTANYISGGICEMTNDAPASVCDSTGVQAAITALNKPAG